MAVWLYVRILLLKSSQFPRVSLEAYIRVQILFNLLSPPPLPIMISGDA